MRRTKMWLAVVGVVFFLITVIFLENPAPVGAEELCNPVTIRYRKNMPPLNTTINKGDCVVWVNFSHSIDTPGEYDVLLSFTEGKQCLLATKAPVGFKMDDKDCFAGGFLSYGETASMVFVKPGTYKYDIQIWQGKKIKDKNSGTIVVK